MNLILPIAGESSRYPNIRPKWLLCHPNGNLMITESIRGLNPASFDNIIIIGLEKHEKKYKCFDAIAEELFATYGNSFNVCIDLINPTKNQPETVYKGLKKHPFIKGGILIKDCDNYFDLDCKILPKINFVAIGDLNKVGEINPSNKSYVNLGKNNTIVNIVEKEVIGNKFCCGAYYFDDCKDFMEYYQKLKHHKKLYISHIIYKMILDGHLFFTEEVKNYIDWGTFKDWKKYIKQFGTIFVDLDGTLVKSSSRHFKPKWGSTEAIKKNVEIINKLYDTGKVHIIIVTARLDQARKVTEKQLKRLKIKYHRLLTGLPHAKRIIVNDYSGTNPYPVSIAVNLDRNNDNLKELLNL